jgi:hypothetical protein
VLVDLRERCDKLSGLLAINTRKAIKLFNNLYKKMISLLNRLSSRYRRFRSLTVVIDEI